MLPICVIFSLLQAVVASSQQTFAKSEEYIDCFPTIPTIPIQNTRSLQDCGALCIRSNACMVVVYDSVTRSCHIMDRFLQDKSDCDFLQNIDHYQVLSGTRNGYDCDLFPESCLKLLPVVYEWHAGKDACQAEGARLLVIDEDMKQNLIVNYMMSNNIQDIWLGISDEQTEGVWRYTDGDIVQYTRFGQGQPDNQYWNQHYVAIRSYSNYNWDDESNGQTYNVVCELVRM